MKLKTLIPIFWLPLVALWTFLFVIYSNLEKPTPDDLVPLLIYFIVSFLFILQLQLVLLNKKEGAFVKFGTANILFASLFISTVFIILKLAAVLSNEWSTGLITLSLITNTIIAELQSYSIKQVAKRRASWMKTNQLLEERQIERSKINSQERDLYIKCLQEWKIYLEHALLEYINQPDLSNELNRVKDILEFSSFFRSNESLLALDQLRENKETSYILAILRSIK